MSMATSETVQELSINLTTLAASITVLLFCTVFWTSKATTRQGLMEQAK